MNKYFFTTLTLLIIIVLTQSCSSSKTITTGYIQKRKYLRGYYIPNIFTRRNFNNSFNIITTNLDTLTTLPSIDSKVEELLAKPSINIVVDSKVGNVLTNISDRKKEKYRKEIFNLSSSSSILHETVIENNKNDNIKMELSQKYNNRQQTKGERTTFWIWSIYCILGIILMIIVFVF